MLTLLGFEQGENFWMNIGRDEEVSREVDAEVESRRGRIRIEVGLIGAGNQEVIDDKILRVGRNGVVIFDKVGNTSQIFDSARSHNVKLIQIRGHKPLTELYDFLKPLVNIKLNDIHTSEEGLKADMDKLSDKFYQ